MTSIHTTPAVTRIEPPAPVPGTWMRLARERPVVMRAASTALVVGPALIAINHGGALLAGDVDLVRLIRMLLTAAVPYLVSTHASVAALRGRTAE